jgi:hypothetical protein
MLWNWPSLEVDTIRVNGVVASFLERLPNDRNCLPSIPRTWKGRLSYSECEDP